PAHITPEQARAFTSAMLHGDPDAASTIVQSAKTVLAGIFPGAVNGSDS
ncbi:MAG: hypothetical protein IAI50_21620, partial [Candidatus Eremiobacteraeota bacterium]|nr:hypothetical protein [Candidatus Eremiobacteraeota bacterium]